MVTSVRGEGTDGENEFVICGPEADLREARSNLAGTDPGPDAPDGVFYFTVTDPEMKAQVAFHVEVTIYDDLARAGAGLALQYTNQDATGPGDIPNTFYPAPPTKTLAGTGEWVVLAWEIENAGFRSPAGPGRFPPERDRRRQGARQGRPSARPLPQTRSSTAATRTRTALSSSPTRSAS